MSFLSSLGDALDLLSALFGGTGFNRRAIILNCSGEKLTIPITPKEYQVKTSQNNKTVDVIDFGEALLFGNPKLKRLTFSGFFPHSKHEYPFITGDSMMPTEIVEMLLKWKESKQPIRVIITDSPVNLMMGLKDFDYSEKDGTRDIYYRLSFIEYKDLNTPLANNDKQVNDATGLKERASDMQKPDTATFQQRANDVLDASKKAYGDYTHWRNVAESNSLKDLAVNNIGRLRQGKKIKI